MKRIKCKYCRAKPRIEFSALYRGIEMCHECACEYSKIFDGTKNRKERKVEESNAEESLVLNAFERGWRAEEEEQGLPHMEISQIIKDDYIYLYLSLAQLAYEELISKLKEENES